MRVWLCALLLAGCGDDVHDLLKLCDAAVHSSKPLQLSLDARRLFTPLGHRIARRMSSSSPNERLLGLRELAARADALRLWRGCAQVLSWAKLAEDLERLSRGSLSPP